MNLINIFSEITCGAGCWSAQEDVCKCSCGGKNHGLTLKGGCADKIVKIDGLRYKLFEVGAYNHLYLKCRDLLHDSKKSLSYNGAYWYRFSHSDKNSPFRLKPISENQKKWAECSHLETIRFPYAIWQKVEVV